jgi:uncharacterized protein (DUF433 family)
MINTENVLYLNRKKLVIKDLEYIIDSKSKEEYSNIKNSAEFFQAIKNSNRELDEMEENIEMILVAASNDKNILKECENYIQQKYKIHLVKTGHYGNSTSAYEYCLELLNNAQIRTSLVNSVPSSLDRITINPNKMNGQPCIRDLRLTVSRVIELLQTYPDRSELYQEFPELTEEDIKQAIIYNNLHSQEPLKNPIVAHSVAHETFA